MIFDGYTKLDWGISERNDGSMRYDDPEQNSNNRRVFFNGRGIDFGKVISANLCHGRSIALVGQTGKGKSISQTDGLITNLKDVYLAITIADCQAIIFFDPIDRAIGIIHAGWRGIRQGIIEEAVNKMKSELGSDVGNILVYIGPHIRNCHFEVGPDVAGEFKDFPEAIRSTNGKTYVDLEFIAKSMLIDRGIKSSNIESSCDCTYCCPEKYFSYRRDKPKNIEAMIAYIGLRK